MHISFRDAKLMEIIQAMQGRQENTGQGSVTWDYDHKVNPTIRNLANV